MTHTQVSYPGVGSVLLIHPLGEGGRTLFMWTIVGQPHMPSGICPVLVPGFEIEFHEPVRLKRKNGKNITVRKATLTRGEADGVADWLLTFEGGQRAFVQELAPDQLVTVTKWPPRRATFLLRDAR